MTHTYNTHDAQHGIVATCQSSLLLQNPLRRAAAALAAADATATAAAGAACVAAQEQHRCSALPVDLSKHHVQRSNNRHHVREHEALAHEIGGLEVGKARRPDLAPVHTHTHTGHAV